MDDGRGLWIPMISDFLKFQVLLEWKRRKIQRDCRCLMAFYRFWWGYGALIAKAVGADLIAKL
jgi:hypothetical protein